MNPEPNSREVAATTAGIARDMMADQKPADRGIPTGQGGGDLNGTAATSILIHQAGTAASAGSIPRLWAANYAGLV